MNVLVLSTSYPRRRGDVAGRFVASAAESARTLGAEIDVVSPAHFRHFGIAYGAGIAQNLRAQPWWAALVPAFVAPDGYRSSSAHSCGARTPSWSRRARSPTRPRTSGSRDRGHLRVEISESSAPPQSPPHVLYVGRLSSEKGVLDFAAGTDGLLRVVVGDGPLRARVPDAVGFVAPEELGSFYDRASVVCVPSRREGYGMTAREAMAHGRALVATTVGGLGDAFVDGETGVAIPTGDPEAPRRAVQGLLDDEPRRRRLGRRRGPPSRSRGTRRPRRSSRSGNVLLREGADRDAVLPAVGGQRRAAARPSSRRISPSSASRPTCSRPTTRSGSTVTRSCSRRRLPVSAARRYVGQKGRKPAEELHGKTGLELAGKHALLAGRRPLLPDENVTWNLTSIPAAIRIVKRDGIDVILTTSPSSSVHFVVAAVKRATDIPWVADLRDSVVAQPHRDAGGSRYA